MLSSVFSIRSATQDRIAKLLEFCSVPRSREEMQQFYGVATREYFRKHVLTPLLETERLKRTIPDKPKSKHQKYVKA